MFYFYCFQSKQSSLYVIPEGIIANFLQCPVQRAHRQSHIFKKKQKTAAVGEQQLCLDCRSSGCAALRLRALSLSSPSFSTSFLYFTTLLQKTGVKNLGHFTSLKNTDLHHISREGFILFKLRKWCLNFRIKLAAYRRCENYEEGLLKTGQTDRKVIFALSLLSNFTQLFRLHYSSEIQSKIYNWFMAELL